MRKKLAPGCVLALVVGALFGLCILVPMTYGISTVVSMNLQRDDFAAFEHTPVGTPVDDVARRAEAMGFALEPTLVPSDAGEDHRVYMKTVLPPYGRWFVHITAVDGGVTNVRTSSLD